MSKNPLQSQDVTAIGHVVAGEGVAQNVGKLAIWQLDAGGSIASPNFL